MELHFKYLDKVNHSSADGDDDLKEDEDEDEAYIRRLDAGLFTLQLVDYIIVEACASGAASIKQRTIQILNQRKAFVTTIRNIIREYAGNLGDNEAAATAAAAVDDADQEDGGKSAEEVREQERQYLLHLVDKF